MSNRDDDMIQRVLALDADARERLAASLGKLGASNDRQLVAYVVAKPEAPEADEEGLRAFAAARLPDAMLPSRYVFLDALPLTATGKVDRRALPAPGERADTGQGDLVLPRNPVEEAIAGMWEEVLGVEPIGAFDDFFDIGGDSLLAIRVVSRIRAALSVDITPRALFDAPELAALAALIQARLDSDARGRERWENNP